MSCWCWAFHVLHKFQMSNILYLCHLLSHFQNRSSLTDHYLSVLPLSIDSQRSHLSSFTMKLMDKFHSPKIKRTPSKKGKQLQPEPAAKSTEKPANKVCVQPQNVCVCVCVVGNTSLSHLFLCVCLPICESIVFLSNVLCSHILLCLCVCARVSLLVPTASQSLWRLALLQQVSEPIKTWMELGSFLNELLRSLLRVLV